MTDRAVEWLDFDRMLEKVPEALAEAARHFGFSAEPGRLESIASGPLMRRYSKALEYDYSPALRSELIAGAEQKDRRNIESALAMLQSAAEESPLLARALSRAENRL
jgi:hypothetical protein